MSQPFELKFVANLGEVTGELRSFLDGLGEAGKVVGQMGESAKLATEGINAVSAAAQQNGEVIAGLVTAAGAMTSAEAVEATELARLTELLGSEANARASLNAQVIDNTTLTQTSSEATATTARTVQQATEANVAYARSMEASAAALTAGDGAERTATQRIDARLAGLQRLSAEQLAARRSQEALQAGLGGFAEKMQEGSMLLMSFGAFLGPLSSHLFSFGAGLGMVGQAAEQLGAKAVAAEVGVAGLVASLAPFLAVAAGAAAVVMTLAEGFHLLKEAVHEGADFADMHLRFTVLIGDADVAREKILALRKLSDESSYQMPEIGNSYARLLAGGIGLDEAEDRLKRLGDIASISGKGTLEGITNVYVKARELNRVSMLEVRQFINQGLNIFPLLEQVSGRTRNQLVQDLRAGKIGFNELDAAVKLATDQGGQFFDALRIKSLTYNGIVTTIQDRWRTLMSTLGEPVQDALRPLLLDLSAMMSKLVPYAKAAGEIIGAAIKTVYGLVENGEFSSSLVREFSIGVDRFVLYLLSQCRQAFDQINTWARESVSSMTQGVMNAIVTPEDKKLLKSIADELITPEERGAKPAQKPTEEPVAIPGLPNDEPTPLNMEERLTVSLVKKQEDQAAAVQRALDTVGKEAPAPAGLVAKRPVTYETAPLDDPEGRTKKPKGTGGRKAEVDEGSEAEKKYKMLLDETSESLALGEISSAKAQEQNRATISAYVDGLRDLQKNLSPTSDKFHELTVRIKDAQQNLAKQSVYGNVKAQLIDLKNKWGDASKQIGDWARQTAETISTTIGTAITNLIFSTGNWRDTVMGAAKSIIGSLIQIGVQMVLSHTLGESLKTAGTASTVSQNATVAASGAAPAVVQSGASYGANWIIGGIAAAAVIALIVGLLSGFEEGGYTGGREGQVAGIVHGEEYVMPAASVRHWGVPALQAISQMRIPVTGPRASSLSESDGGSSASGFISTGRTAKGGGRRGRDGDHSPQVHVNFFQDKEAFNRHLATHPDVRHIVADHVRGSAVDLGLPTGRRRGGRA